MVLLEFGDDVDALLGVQVEDVYAFFAEVVDAALGVDGVADDDLVEAELVDESGAVPAGCEGGDEDLVVPVGVAAGGAEGVSFAVEGAVALLNETVAAGAEEGSVDVEDGSADGDSAFADSDAGLFDGDGEHALGIEGGDEG